MNDVPKWVWIAGGGVLLLLLLASGRSGGGGGAQQAPADTSSADALAASELQAKQSTLAQLINYAGSVDLANVQSQADARVAEIQKELGLAEIEAQKSAAATQAQYAYEAQNTQARQATKQSFWDAVGNTALGIASVVTSARSGGGSMVGQTVPPRSSFGSRLNRPVGGFGTRSFG